jgi:aspartyl protease family protein
MNHLSHTLKIVAVWLVLGGLLFVVVKHLDSQQVRTRFVTQGEQVEIERGPDGHYHWPGTINGREVDFLVDTGATGTAISQSLARELGLQSEGEVQSHTAGGVVEGQVVRATLTLRGGVRAENLRVVALPQLGDRPLLGMDVLGRLRWQQGDGVLKFDLRAKPEPR